MAVGRHVQRRVRVARSVARGAAVGMAFAAVFAAGAVVRGAETPPGVPLRVIVSGETFGVDGRTYVARVVPEAAGPAGVRLAGYVRAGAGQAGRAGTGGVSWAVRVRRYCAALAAFGDSSSPMGGPLRRLAAAGRAAPGGYGADAVRLVMAVVARVPGAVAYYLPPAVSRCNPDW